MIASRYWPAVSARARMKPSQRGGRKRAGSTPTASSGGKLKKPALEPEGNAAVEPKGGRQTASFYSQPCEDLAKALLGKVLVRKLADGQLVKGKIVETEAYLGGDDKAAHSYQGKRTSRNEAMYMSPGTVYVYHIYGMYTCINISSKGEGAAVLIRAIEPVEGLETMRANRSVKRSAKSKPLKDKEIGSGPSKLTQAMGISKDADNQVHLTDSEHIWVEPGESVAATQIEACARIGVDYAGEWAKKPLRFYVRGNPHVSVINKFSISDKSESGLTEKSCKVQNSIDVEGVPNSVDAEGVRITAPTFFSRDTVTLARDLLGQVLVRRTAEGLRLSGHIVETEAYLGVKDPCCHCYGGKRTPRTETMFMPPGTAYVYTVYYSSCCFNISSEDEGAVVLIRALEPVEGADIMRQNRKTKLKSGNKLKDANLCNGPSNLCTAFNITKSEMDKLDLTTSSVMWLEKDTSIDSNDVVITGRIGLKKYPEEAFKPYRFYIRGNSSVSVRDMKSELNGVSTCIRR